MKKLLIALVLLVGSHLSDAQLPATAQEVSPLLTGEKSPEATLHDGNGDLSKKIGVAFQSPANYQKVLKDNSDPSFLPVPTVLIVDTEGKILYEYINPDYKVRIPAELLKINAAYFADK